MGYYTYFHLDYYGSDGDESAVQEFEPTDEFNFRDGVKSLLDDSLDCFWKWYHWQDDMKLLASKFPNVLFILTGNGEEAGDLWEYRIKGTVSEYHEYEMPKFTTTEVLLPCEIESINSNN